MCNHRGQVPKVIIPLNKLIHGSDNPMGRRRDVTGLSPGAVPTESATVGPPATNRVYERMK